MFEVHSWVDESTGDTKLVFSEGREERSRTVFNLYTHTFRRLAVGEQIPPEFVLTIPWNMTQEIQNALAQWLAKKGIRNDYDAKIEGTLNATRYHLEDLRELLKLTPLKLYKVDPQGNITETGALKPNDPRKQP